MTLGNLNWQAGQPIRAKNTVMTQKCGIDPGKGRGWVTHADRSRISFYFERGEGAGWLEAVCDVATFAANFQMEPLRPINKAYEKSKHHAKLFPKDFCL